MPSAPAAGCRTVPAVEVRVEQQEVGVEQGGRAGRVRAGARSVRVVARRASLPRREALRAGAARRVALRAWLVRAVVVAAVVAGQAVVGGTAVAPAAAAAGPSERWTWPLDGPRGVVRPFAPGPTRYSPGHYGADLHGRLGQPVRAAGAGRVSYAGLLAGRGVVVVDHGGLRTTYEPLAVAVRLGAQVPRGGVLGRLSTGHACGRGTCLHLGLRRGEDYLDPLRLFGGPVRLLPDDGGPARGWAGAGRSGERGAGPGAGWGAGRALPGHDLDGAAPAAAPPLPPTGPGVAPPHAGGRAASDAGPGARSAADRVVSRVPEPDAGRAPSLPGAAGSGGDGPLTEPGARVLWGLTPDEWPLAGSAALALLAGLLLVRTSGPRPPTAPAGAGTGVTGAASSEADGAAAARSTAPPAAAPPAAPASLPPAAPPPTAPDLAADLLPPAGVVQLDHERLRRRAG